MASLGLRAEIQFRHLYRTTRKRGLEGKGRLQNFEGKRKQRFLYKRNNYGTTEVLRRWG
jgi:hypothetical protein